MMTIEIHFMFELYKPPYSPYQQPTAVKEIIYGTGLNFNGI